MPTTWIEEFENVLVDETLAQKTGPSDARLLQVRLNLQGWSDVGMQGNMRGWRDDQGDFISLFVTNKFLGLPQLSDEVALQRFFRKLAESRRGGLIEVHVSAGPFGPTVHGIYKRLHRPAYTFTGMFVAPSAEPPQVWTIVAKERGTTGVREAVITVELMNAGVITLEDYPRSWADPYDPGYLARDPGPVLRFVSDDESYDDRFPDHPLSKVRRVLTTLPSFIDILPAGSVSPTP